MAQGQQFDDNILTAYGLVIISNIIFHGLVYSLVWLILAGCGKIDSDSETIVLLVDSIVKMSGVFLWVVLHMDEVPLVDCVHDFIK